MAKKEGVVSWFDVPGQENRGVILELEKGNHWFLKGEDYDDAIKAQLVRDNIFEFDTAPDPKPGTKPGQKGYDRLKVSDLDFRRKAAKPEETADYHEKNFPQQQPAVVEPETNRPQLARFEVHATPVGDANSDEWQVAFETETEDGHPMPNVPFTFKYGTGANNIITDKTGDNGCFEQTIHVPNDVTARAVVNAVYSIPNIPLGGQEGNIPAAQLSWWDRNSNRIFVIATLLLFLTFGMKFYHSYRWVTLPYEQRQIIQPQADIPTTTPGRESTFPTGLSSPAATPKTDPTDSIWWGFKGWGSLLFWNWLPSGSWGIWLLYLVLWFFLTIACFLDDFKRAIVKVYTKAEHGLESWDHKRKPFSFAVATVREGNRRKVQYYFNNQLIGDKPNNLVTNIQEAWSKMTWGKIFFTSLQGDLVWEALRRIVGNLFRR